MSPLEISVRDHVAWFTLNRRNVGNAIDYELALALDKALSDAQQCHDIHCLVLAGAGQHFCSGIDLRSLQIPSTNAQDSQKLTARCFLDRIIEQLLSMRMPIVAAVNGAAAGAGMTLALTADVLLMAEDAYFLPSFTRLGLVPDNGITCLLPERIGASRARAVLMLSERIEAHTAYEWGLAYQVLPPDVLHGKAGEFAARLAAGPRRALAATRRLLNQPDARDFHKQLREERYAHRDALHAREHVEGIAAFFEHREPEFVLGSTGSRNSLK